APTESRIPVFGKQVPAPSKLPIRNAYAVRSQTNLSHLQNERPNKRPSSLLELFGRNKVGALPVTAKVNPMSAENSAKTSVAAPPQMSTSFTISSPKHSAATSSQKASVSTPEHTFIVSSEKILTRSGVGKSKISDLENDWGPNATSSPHNKKNDVTSPVTSSHVGHRVCVNGTKVGILRYFGEIKLEKGTFCGIELDEPAGLNDGSLNGIRYFTCKPQHGIFAPVHIVKPLPGGSWTQQFRRKHSPEAFKRRLSATYLIADSSGPYSLLDGLDTSDENLTYHVEKNGEVPEPGQTILFSNNIHHSHIETRSGSAPTPRIAAHNAALWDCRTQLSCSVGALPSSESRKLSELSQETSNQSSLECDESLGILSPHQLHTTIFDSTDSSDCCHFIPSHTHKQSSFELDESLGILTPDQMLDFTVCAESCSIGRAVSFEDMEVFMFTDFVGEQVDLPDRIPSETDELSSNYHSSEFPKFPTDSIQSPDCMNQSPDCMNLDDTFLVSKAEDVSMQELDLLSNDATTPEQHCASNQMLDHTMCCTSEDLSENVCQVVTSNGSDGDFTPASIRVGQDISDRTLSPEDLPMDAPYQEVMSEILQKAELTSESGHETAGMSGATSAGPSSRSSAAPPPPSSFVTSVTSITSLDNGYQGDGEWSRPASRGADHSPTSHRVIKMKTSADPMTDSDFFTESDADMHDELATGNGRGDRRAQVIDGTLYGTNLQAGGTVILGQHHPSFTASINEEMESSGVYSDLDRRPDEPISDGKEFQEEKCPVEVADFSPDVSTKTVSSRSEQSQVKESTSQFTNLISQSPCENTKEISTPDSIASNELLSENNLKNQQVIVNKIIDHKEAAIDRNVHKKGLNSSTLKKYKMPKRNVVSKIKAMIENPSTSNVGRNEDENQENRRPCTKSKKGGGRWDAVMNKIAQGQAEQKLKTRSLKEVKSKVFANLAQLPTTQSEARCNTERSRKTSSSSIGTSQRPLKENTALKTKSRRARTRSSTSSLTPQQQQQQQQSQANTNGASHNSSPHSSISDISVNQSHALSKASTKSSSSLPVRKARP
ncbi:hypothetical protein L9F63_011113, partial [Diploptera punctata]